MAATSNCPHLAELWNDSASEGILGKYKLVLAWNVQRSMLVRPAKRRKVAAPACGTCCWTDGHVLRHLADTGHRYCGSLAPLQTAKLDRETPGADSKTGSIFCRVCNDFVWDHTLETIRTAASLQVQESQTRFQVQKKPREHFSPWTPNEKEMALLEGAEVIPCYTRRGLVNLGQTCFLNVVLQSLIHNPLLRNYYLSDRHNSKQCKFENCTSCEMDKLFTEVYSDSTVPYGPIAFLAVTWKASAELSGYAQQDAHELFISTLNQIHSTSRGSTNVSCNCIVHSTFSGQLQSQVTCERCGNSNTTVDPILDVSLELKGKSGEISSSENTLAACLRRFTQPEKLGPKEYTCSKCGRNPTSEATKRMCIQTLPPVLSFQFKRFEHKTSDKSSARKIDAQVRIPSSLNMAPYTAIAMGDAEKESHGSVPSYPGPEGMYEYDLFAVINHEGQIDNGHYTNFARLGDEWYRFDDDKVTHSTLAACLSSPVYMCFYVKRYLDYKANTVPSYVLIRESEAAREKELEKEKELARMKELEDDLLATV